jgi:hypothetical protein
LSLGPFSNPSWKPFHAYAWHVLRRIFGLI